MSVREVKKAALLPYHPFLLLISKPLFPRQIKVFSPRLKSHFGEEDDRCSYCCQDGRSAGRPFGLKTEVGIYKRKQENTLSTQKAIKKKRKKTRSRPRKRPRKKKNFSSLFLTLSFSFINSHLCHFNFLVSAADFSQDFFKQTTLRNKSCPEKNSKTIQFLSNLRFV